MKNSIVSKENGLCVICGRPKQAKHHLIFGNGMRREADEDGLFIDICNNCHNMAYFRPEQIHENTMAEHLSKALGQFAWERWALATQIAEMNGTTPEEVVEDVEGRFLARYGRRFM